MPRASLEIIDGILGNGGGRTRKPLENFKGTASIEVMTPKKKAAPKVEEAEEKAEDKGTRTRGKAQLKVEAEPAAEVEAVEEDAEEAEATAAKAAPKSRAKTTSRAKSTGVAIATVHYSGKEYIEVMNNSDRSADLGGWSLRDKNDTAQAYTFAEGTELEAGKSLKVYTEPGHAYTFDSKRPIWNDQGDEIELVDANGNVVDGFAYGSYASESEEASSDEESEE
jgi:hypothetical protein